jgi:hypothetical protein
MRPQLGRLALLTVLALPAAVTACGPRQSGTTANRQQHDLISRENLTTQRFNTAYEAVQALRANWLQPRGADSFSNPSQILVYLDNVKLGGVEALRTLHPNDISFIRRYDAAAASSRWGMGHGQGVIYVATLRAEAPKE